MQIFDLPQYVDLGGADGLPGIGHVAVTAKHLMFDSGSHANGCASMDYMRNSEATQARTRLGAHGELRIEEGGNVVTRSAIPWAGPTLFGSEEALVLDALRSTWISGGPYVEHLEREIAQRMSVRNAIAVSNGTTAIELALRGLNLRPGAEIIVPAFGFVAAANMVFALGFVPRYADIDPDAWLLDAGEIARVATDSTQAVIPLHLYGNVANMSAIAEAAGERNLTIVEDAAEAAFSRYRGACAGTIGAIGTLSFQATKTITTGEGGMVLTNDDDLAARCRKLRDHGMRPDKRYWHDVIGHNFRMTNLQAALGCGQLEALEQILEMRRALAMGYRERLRAMANVRLQRFDGDVEPVVWATVVQIVDDRDVDTVRARRDRVIQGMAEDGIETRPGFYDLSLLPPYGCSPLPVAQRVSASTIALPTLPRLGAEDLDRICGSLETHVRTSG